MSPEGLITDLSARGVMLAVMGDAIEFDAPPDTLTPDDIEALKACKLDVIRILRLADGLPVDDDATALLACEDVDPDTVPACPSCSQLCDTQTLDKAWQCSRCDPLAESRRERTKRLIRLAESIRYTDNRHG